MAACRACAAWASSIRVRMLLGELGAGIEINGKEYCFGGNTLVETTGVYMIEPKKHDVFTWRYSIDAGSLKDEGQMYPVLYKLMKKYRAN